MPRLHHIFHRPSWFLPTGHGRLPVNRSDSSLSSTLGFFLSMAPDFFHPLARTWPIRTGPSGMPDGDAPSSQAGVSVLSCDGGESRGRAVLHTEDTEEPKTPFPLCRRTNPYKTLEQTAPGIWDRLWPNRAKGGKHDEQRREIGPVVVESCSLWFPPG
mgnify:CR=1 FL=1